MAERLDRRSFLARAATLTASAPLALEAALPWAPAVPSLRPAVEPLRKCISLGGYAPLTVPDGHPNDYRLHGNREYIRDLSGTRWVKLWVSWAHLQEELRPASREESWRHLNAAPQGQAALRRLDRQVRAINDDAARVGGMGVILTLYQEYPTWASGASADDPARVDKPLAAKTPSEVGVDSPWAWFVEHLIARYRPAPPAPEGPIPDVRTGNPAGAHIQALEVCNEPNYLLWPQVTIVETVATMIETAAALAAAHGGPAILGPATSDFPDFPHETASATDWLTFSERLLERLRGLRPGATTVGWSHHNYLDVSDERSGPTSRARRVADLLYARNWRGGGGGDRRLWLTEAGFDMHPRQADLELRLAQARKIEHNFAAMSVDPDVHMWTQHTISDVVTNDFKSGLRDEFVPGVGPGVPRPAFDSWARLPGSGGM